MRVADQSFYTRLLAGLAMQRARTNENLGRLADGKNVRVASDDPSGHHASMGLRTRLVRIAGFDRSADAARTDLATIERALSEVVGLVTEARTEALAGASGPFDAANGIRADQVESLRDHLLALANTEQGGRYLFSGTQTRTPPFDTAGTYSGNSDEVDAPVDVNQEIGATLSGERVFQGGVDLFAALDDLVQALRINDTAAVAATIPTLTAGLDHLNEVHAEIGIRLQDIDKTIDRHADETLALVRRVGEIEDADIAEVIVALESSDTTSAALSAAASRFLGRSLFDYLG